MPESCQVVFPGPTENSVRTQSGEILYPPSDWALLPPGDAALTRRVKEAGPSWLVQEKRGRKRFSRGLWAAKATIEAIQATLAAERAKPQHARRRAADGQRREREQSAYVAQFDLAVRAYLAFDPRYAELEQRLAAAVTEHATPVGSGTVARTKRIPIERRAEAAVIAWMRHATTAYDGMVIPRVKGQRREVRRLLAQQSKKLLAAYRTGVLADGDSCPLQRAVRERIERSKAADQAG